MQTWPAIILLWLFLSIRGSQSDEEDPLQHVAQVAAKQRLLTHVLKLLHKSTEKEQEELPDENKLSEPCNHKVLDLKITGSQVDIFKESKMSALRLSNLLNNLFLGTPIINKGLSVLTYPSNVFYGLARAALEGEPSLVSIGIAFLRGEFKLGFDSPDDIIMQSDLFGAYAYRRRGRGGRVMVADLAALFNNSYDHADVEGTQWFTYLTYRHPLRSINTSEIFTTGTSFAITKSHDGLWFLKPILDCGASGDWVVAYSLPFFSSNDDEKTAKIKGVVIATVPLRKIDINQCEDSDDILENIVFGGTHKCDTVTTQCVPVRGMGFVRGGYKCECRATHHIPNTVHQYFNGTDVEREFNVTKRKSHNFTCELCPKGCLECSGIKTCKVQYNNIARFVLACSQVASLFICILMILAVFKMRRCKVIAASLWTMLEVMLIGAIVIYSSIFFRYMEPTAFVCLLEPWFREIGFSLFYGAIVLKLYRSLVDHRTRKAHRYVIRDRDLLRYLSGIIAFMLCYLAAFAAFTSQLALEGHPILAKGRINIGLTFTFCRIFWWDYVTEAGEISFVAFGLYLWWQLQGASRDARDLNELRERRAHVISLTLELLSSLTLYALRHFVWLKAHPDHVFIAYFIRTHVTVTLSLMLILFPKLWCVGGWKGREASRRTFNSAEGGAQELRLCEAIANGEIETANLSQMDPEEIRTELRRVYTQLEELRSRTMRKDNPHISKRRGGRKPTHRRFSLQNRKGSKDKYHSRRHHHHHFEAFDDNKTPEESVCSIEGPSVLSIYADGPSTYSDAGTPSILHRGYK